MKSRQQNRIDTVEGVFDIAHAAWRSHDFSAVRQECARVLSMDAIPSHFRSYAGLCIAQSHNAEGDSAAAKAEYARVAADSSYPDVHRYEARECIREIERRAAGLPAFNPEKSKCRPVAVNPKMEYFVAPDGSDENPGTADQPFATLAGARDAVRSLRCTGGLPKGGVAVTLKAGEYHVSAAFELTAEDGGTASSPVVYRAQERGKAVLYGGARLTGFVPVSDRAVLERLPEESRGKVHQCDLKALGITDYGELKVRGFSQPPSPPTLELYFNGEPQTLARWPNKGFVEINRLVAPGDKQNNEPSVFEYIDDRPRRWTQAEDPWLFGYFRYLWADGTAKIGKIDADAKTITTAEAYAYGGKEGMSEEQGIIYYAFNLLEEIDQPGEWYLDRTSGILYLWPPSDPARATIEIGVLSKPMLTVTNASHVRVEGLVFDLGRFNCMTVRDSDSFLIAGCTIKRFAGTGITIAGGKANCIYGCDIHTIGRQATDVNGGDRETLTPAGHLVENCIIHNFGRIDRTYTPAIHLSGVGNRVAHNLMYDCPSSALRFEGNDFLIEYNEVHSAVQESDDQGAMESFGNPTYRGVTFRYNRFHHIGKTGDEGAVCGQAAIRFDDAISGMLVYGNVFERCSNGSFGAIQINGGRDNVMDNNVFAECKQGVSGVWNPSNHFWKMIREGRSPESFYTNELYLRRYPAIAHMMEPSGVNSYWRNIFYNCGRTYSSSPYGTDELANGVVHRKGERADSSAALSTAPDAVAGFRQIPQDEIGLYEDAHRASWPVRTQHVELSDWRCQLDCKRPVITGGAVLSDQWQAFAPMTKETPPPSGDQLLHIPESVACDDRILTPTTLKPIDGLVDLSPALGGTEAWKTAWIYIPFTTGTAGEASIGLGADWWLQAWIDGQLACDTTKHGNVNWPPAGADHMATASLEPGEHLLVVRFLSGSATSVFAALGSAAAAKLWDETHWWVR